jgi:hypothetical protein
MGEEILAFPSYFSAAAEIVLGGIPHILVTGEENLGCPAYFSAATEVVLGVSP